MSLAKAVVRSRNDLHRWADEVANKIGSETFPKPYTVTIKRFIRPRTLDQNAKLHAMIRELALHVGHTPEEVKEFIKAELGPVKTIKIGDASKTIPQGSSEWDVEICSYVIEELYRIGAEVGCAYSEQ